jgi:hypothetical protein
MLIAVDDVPGFDYDPADLDRMAEIHDMHIGM